MSEPLGAGGELSPVKRALLELRELRARLDASENRLRQPIAIIGLGLRFPGACSDSDSYWRLLRDGVDAVSVVPPDRWDIDAYYDPDPSAPGKMVTRWGGSACGEKCATIAWPASCTAMRRFSVGSSLVSRGSPSTILS